MPKDLSQDIVQALQHFVVPESQYAKSTPGENCASPHIEFDAVAVLATIDLDNQAGFDANQVDDVATDWKSSSKLEVSEAPPTQAGPEQAFGVGL